MDTNKILIGNVYQITKWEVGTYSINYTYEKVKEKALLFRQKDSTYLDVETKLVYEANLNQSRKMGDAIVFSSSLIPFNSLLNQEDRCSDMPHYKVRKVYQKVKTNINDVK